MTNINKLTEALLNSEITVDELMARIEEDAEQSARRFVRTIEWSLISVIWGVAIGLMML